MTRSSTGTDSQTVPVLRKAIRLLGAVADGSAAAASLAQLSAAHGVATTTCFRILHTFRAEGWVAPSPAGGWRLSAGLLPLLRGLAPYADIAERLSPALSSLAATTGLTAKLSVLEGNESVTLARQVPPSDLAVSSPPGARFAVVLGATGAALLAAAEADIDAAIAAAPAEAWQRQSPHDLEQRVTACRAQGWCYDVGSYHARVAAVAAPLPPGLTPPGVVACVSLIGWPEDIDGEARTQVAKTLLDSLRRMAGEIQGRGK